MVKPVSNELGCEATSLTQATIMIIDEEPTTMEAMQGYLEDAGFQHFVLVEDSFEPWNRLRSIDRIFCCLI
ncbi:MAG: hypothetical protein R3B95_05320 [Nitrospirales bacterium]|nr:hypothetical protein [Nitrospirales bacterium]